MTSASYGVLSNTSTSSHSPAPTSPTPPSLSTSLPSGHVLEFYLGLAAVRPGCSSQWVVLLGSSRSASMLSALAMNDKKS
ncbi:C2 domain-containing protein [Psidium guajava]|nr:C2 domain-containing protein [Psidium guajava]